VKLGRLLLKGHVATGERRDQIVTAMKEEIPGLTSVDDQVTANDDALTALRSMLAAAGLADRLQGHLDRGNGNRLVVDGMPREADLETWAEVRGRLASLFGPSLQIVEDLRVAPAEASPGTPAPRNDVVAAVKGPMPYVLLSNGAKLSTSTADTP
jgi:hypothetical protein